MNTQLIKSLQDIQNNLGEVIKTLQIPEVPQTPQEKTVICSIVKDSAPSAKQDLMTREILKIAQSVGCNMWSGFLNEQEVLDPNQKLPEYGQYLGMEFAADTVDAMAIKLPSDRLQAYFQGLERLGAKMLIINDADGKSPDGSLRYPLEMLKRMVSQIKQYSTLPLMASLTAGADPVAYKKEFGFDLVEAQTFGTISELKSFLKRGFDVYCLDTQKSASVTFLKQARAVILAANPQMIRFYAGFDYDDTDWRKMPLQVKEITETVNLLKGKTPRI